MSEKMSVHRGLAELKLLDSRIDKAIGEGVYCKHNKRSNTKINGMTIKEYEDKVIRASVDKVNSLIERRGKIKSAIVKSNAITEIEVAGIKMPVAVAIDRKNSIEHERQYLYELKHQYSRTINTIEKNNSTLTNRADEQINLLYSNKDNVDPNKIKILRDDYIEENTFDLIDPVGIKGLLDKLEKDIEDFETEIDFKLSESNALTMIEIE